jgi:methylated-DNA-[protein]-cysteine S-methyltransferase
MNTINIAYVKTGFGELIVGSYQSQLCLCDWRYRKARDRVDQRIKQTLDAHYVLQEDEIIAQTINELDEYSVGNRQTFSVPLLLAGSEFQQQVWRQLIKIPYGTSVSYLALSKLIGNEKAIRAVANANGANAISIIVPCHRVIGSDGKLVGYAGGIDTKKRLLAMEATNTGQGAMRETLDLF